MLPRFASFVVALALGFLFAPGAVAEGFERIVRPADGRTLAAEIADLDGDGRNDLVRFVSALPPRRAASPRLLPLVLVLVLVLVWNFSSSSFSSSLSLSPPRRYEACPASLLRPSASLTAGGGGRISSRK